MAYETPMSRLSKVIHDHLSCRPLSRDAQDFVAQPTQFHAIFQRALPVALRLACCPEPVARQLFEPLVMALVHWFTRAARRQEARHTAHLIIGLKSLPIICPLCPGYYHAWHDTYGNSMSDCSQGQNTLQLYASM